MTTPITTSYDRPTKGTLVVRLDNGEEWDATPDDIAAFGLVYSADAYESVRRSLAEALGTSDLTGHMFNPIRYLIEVAICYPDLHTAETMAEIHAEVAALAHAAGATTEERPT